MLPTPETVVGELVDDLLFEPARESNSEPGRTFFVGAEDKQIRVGLTWQKTSTNPKLTLIEPSGGVLSIADPKVREESGSVFHIYDIKGPEVGHWTAKITGAGSERAVLSVLSSSGLKLGLDPDRHRWVPGQLMTLTASLGAIVSGVLKPVANAEFAVTVERPDGLLSSTGFSVNPQPSGLYRIILSDTALAGTYNVRVTATIDAGTEHEQLRSRLHLASSPGFIHADGHMEGGVLVIPVDVNGNRLGQGHDVKCEWIGPELGTWLGGVESGVDGVYARPFVAGDDAGAAAAYCVVDGVVIDDALIVNFFKPDDKVSDLDGDGIVSWNDNCPFEANPGQTDADGDRIGDACEVEVPGLGTGEGRHDGRDYLLWWFLSLILWLCFIVIFVYWRKR